MRFLIMLFFTFTAVLANAQDYKFGEMKIFHPWTRLSKPGDTSAQVYMIIENRRIASDYLVFAECEYAETVEIYTFLKEPNFFGVKELKTIEIAPNTRTNIGWRNEIHQIKLGGLKQPLMVGRQFWIHLKFQNLGTVKVLITVEKENFIGSVSMPLLSLNQTDLSSLITESY